MGYEYSLLSENIILREVRNHDEKINYLISEDGSIFTGTKKRFSFSTIRFLHTIRSIFQDIFLPQGYPNSTSSDYLQYQIWDTVQAFCSTISGILTTHAILKGIGVGNQEADALSATVTWILKDGTGMIGRITFAWYKGFLLDTECKKWRLTADVINDVALGVELLLGLVAFHGFSSLLLCLSTSMKAIVGVAGGATRAAITQHQAVRGNMGDVSAKDGSQETCVNLIGSFVGLYVLTRIENNAWCTWLLFFLVTVMHVYANYKAVKSLNMQTLNTSRMLLLMVDFLKFDEVSSVKEINQRENVILGFGLTDRKLCRKKLHLGCSFNEYLKKEPITIDELKKLRNLYRSFPYVIVETETDLYIILKENITDKDILQSFFHSIILGLVVSNGYDLKISYNQFGREFIKLAEFCQTINYPEIYVNEFVIRKWDKFINEASLRGWNFSRHQLSVNEWRSKWV